MRNLCLSFAFIIWVIEPALAVDQEHKDTFNLHLQPVSHIFVNENVEIISRSALLVKYVENVGG